MAQKTILIVDDEEAVLQMLSDKLVGLGYAAISISNGKEVTEKCKIKKPDLVILDIAMPDMDGYAVTRALRDNKEFEDIPVLFLTGKELEHRGIEKRIEELGAYDYLMKPCKLEDFAAKVKEIIG